MKYAILVKLGGEIILAAINEAIAVDDAIAVNDAIAVDEAELASSPIPVAEPNLSEWLSNESLEDLATWLEVCQTPDDLNMLRQIAPAEALRLAARLLPPEKKELIRHWVTSGYESPNNHDYG